MTVLLEIKENSTAIKIQTIIMATEVLAVEQVAEMEQETARAAVLEMAQGLVAEMEVESLRAYEEMMDNPQGSPEDMKQFEELMKGYHDLVDHGHREFYKIEA